MSKAVKRGGKEHNIYLAKKSAAEEELGRNYWWVNRQFVLDSTVIAIGDMMEADGKSFEEIWDFMDKFSVAYLQVEHDIAYEVGGEADEEAMNRDKVGSSWVAKDKVDRLLKQYVRPEEFKTFRERYDEIPLLPYTMKDSLIASLQRLVGKKDDEITKLKGQIKLMKIKRGEGE